MADVDDVVILLSTFPDPAKAAEIARLLVEEGLAACVNLVPGIRSIYRWQGATHDDVETLTLAKTTRGRAEALRLRLLGLHPYQLPEVLEVPVTGGHGLYLAWVVGQVSP